MTQRYTVAQASALLEDLPAKATPGSKMVETLLSAFCSPRFIFCSDVERVARILQLNDALTRARAALPLDDLHRSMRPFNN